MSEEGSVMEPEQRGGVIRSSLQVNCKRSIDRVLGEAERVCLKEEGYGLRRAMRQGRSAS
jgi:hypothetical protein